MIEKLLLILESDNKEKIEDVKKALGYIVVPFINAKGVNIKIKYEET